MYTHIYIKIYKFACIHIYLYVHICIFVCIHVNIYIYYDMYTYIILYIYIYIDICVRVYMRGVRVVGWHTSMYDSGAAHRNASRHTYKCVMSHIWKHSACHTYG